MLRFLFTLDNVPPERVYSEATAYYCLDGTFGLAHGTQVVFEEDALPVVEVAVWLSGWWTSRQPPLVYEPDWADSDYETLLAFAPDGNSGHRLTHTYGGAVAQWTADRTEWKNAIMQFREDVRQVVLERYGVRLDFMLPPLQDYA